MNPTPYQEAIFALGCVMDYVAQATEYSWSVDFKLEMIERGVKQYQERMSKIDFLSFTKEQLYTLGFANWGEKYLLIPLWIVPCLPTGTKVYTINDQEKIIGVDKLDNDVRGGCVAYGIKPSDHESNDKVDELKEGLRILS